MSTITPRPFVGTIAASSGVVVAALVAFFAVARLRSALLRSRRQYDAGGLVGAFGADHPERDSYNQA